MGKNNMGKIGKRFTEGVLVLWFYNFICLWLYGFIVLWLYGFVVSKMSQMSISWFLIDICPISKMLKTNYGDLHHFPVPDFSKSGPKLRNVGFPILGDL